MKPLDYLEWLQALALTDDFAREALEVVESLPWYEECQEYRDAIDGELARGKANGGS